MAKTPISLLKDFCDVHEMTAEYKVESASGPPHAPTFVYHAQVGTFEARASASRKQSAKHAAAKAILEQLLTKEGGYEEGFESEGTMIDLAYVQGIMTETSCTNEVPIESSQVNSVSILQELCIKYELQPPLYETKEEVGLPHEKTFTMSCIIGHLEEIGTGKSKKSAKRIAAELMIAKLKELDILDEKKKKKKDDLKCSLEEIDTAGAGDSSLEGDAVTNLELCSLEPNVEETEDSTDFGSESKVGEETEDHSTDCGSV